LKRIGITELLIIGGVAGLLAGLSAGLAAWCLGRYVMDIQFNAFAQAIILGLVLGISSTPVGGLSFSKAHSGCHSSAMPA
jgi:putative ABC transport system permease protein